MPENRKQKLHRNMMQMRWEAREMAQVSREAGMRKDRKGEAMVAAIHAKSADILAAKLHKKWKDAQSTDKDN